jgi:hypothetical protein
MSVSYFNFNRPNSTLNSLYTPGLFDIASAVIVSGNTQTVTSAPDTEQYNQIRRSWTTFGGPAATVSTVLENGENKGLVSIAFGNIVRGPQQIPLISAPIRIDARQTGFQSVDGISFQSINGDQVYVLNKPGRLQPGQNYVLANDGTAGEFSNNISPAPCFVTGSLIYTSNGDVSVENLQVGATVITNSGLERTVRWIGTRSLDCNRHPNPTAVWPVRILKNAFGCNRPARDLWLSPDHSVCVHVLDEVLVPIKHLINDATIVQVEVAEITYWHVELDSHDILLAEGLPAESFLDTGVRAGFENGAEHMVLHPDFSPLTLDAFCRPLVQEGPIVDAVRLRLLARASNLGWTLTSEDNLHAVVDGAVVYPEREGAIARFAIPADTQEIRLVSRSFVPERVHVGAGDGRRLGVPMRGLSVVDNAGVTRSLPIGSKALSQGFSFVQGAAERPWRWTTGEAVVPSVLWVGTEGGFSLIVGLAPEEGTLQAWQAPAKVMSQEASEASPEAAAA